LAEGTFLAERFAPSDEEILSKEGYFNLFIYHNGRFVKGNEARITPFDHGVLLGDGIFEGIRAYGGYVFKLDEHLDRLYDSAKAMGLRIPLSKEEMKQAIVLTLRKNGLRDAHVRPVALRGPGRLGVDPRRSVRPTVLVLAYPFPPLLGEKPVRLLISSVRRKSPQSVDSKVKSTSYIDNIMAKLQANAAGMDDAILLDLDGYVGEACGENIFAVKGKRLCTPPTTAALHGITRAVVMEIAAAIGLKVHEANMTPQELYTADEAFLTGTAAEIVPIAEIDGRKIGETAPGAFTHRLIEEFKEYRRRNPGTPIYD